jgi:hypothetical protein
MLRPEGSVGKLGTILFLLHKKKFKIITNYKSTLINAIYKRTV